MFIIVYHYIIDPASTNLALPGPTIKEFEGMLDALNYQYDIVDLPTLVQKKKSNDADKYCSLTFDDGLTDHYRIYGELKSRNIKATFFPVASVLDGFAPSAIKMHIILSKMDTISIVEKLESYLSEQGLDEFLPIPRDKKINDLRPIDDVLTANLKQTLQSLPFKKKEEFVNEQFKWVVDNEEKFCREFFMTPEQIRDMYKHGMTIGSHSYSHTALSTMSYAEQKKDLLKSKMMLEDVIGNKITTISYPYGSYNQETIAIVRELGFEQGVVFNHRMIKSSDDDLLLSNLDCRDRLPLANLID